MVPQGFVARVQSTPVLERLQVTMAAGVAWSPVTCAVNCWVSKSPTVVELGANFTRRFRFTVSVAFCVGSAADVAVTVTVGGPGSGFGAVYVVVVVSFGVCANVKVPQSVPEQPAPETDQLTTVLLVLETFAAKTRVFVDKTVEGLAAGWVIAIVAGGPMVTFAMPILEGSKMSMASTWMLAFAGAVFGAV